MIRDWLPALRHRIGHRGAFLLFLAALDVAYARRLAWPDPHLDASPLYAYLTGIAPGQVWAVLWGGVGVLCGWGAFRVRDAIAFTAAMALKFVWAAVNLLGWLFASLPQGDWATALWVFAALVVYDVANWPEPAREPGGTG
ncbi:hypothetical protein F5972_08035 [Microbispora cellulosiformans]|uniref:DoxX family protein n=1 Tax=Microbispora cellulosiformans TaxID=2614688 RepID=A0A5J5K518_9ACTN|nr:hypothetical protein [Microbispora cellulosiformans]KAA9379596.1 hypothetical protein F5972_08035 [Microbispora cellulosiformans]